MMIRGNISRGGVEIQKAALPRRVRGFTLIEMTVVITIIAILAAIILGALPAINEKRTRSKVRTELRQLVMAIEAYKEKHGFYPPDNTNNIAQPPLFYELVGTTVASNPDGSNARYLPLNGMPELTQMQIENYFGPPLKGFVNSSPDTAEVKNFYTTAKTNSHYVQSPFVPGNESVLVLRVPARGKNAAVPAAEEQNTWKYIVGKGPASAVNPTNNPNTFDLWADVVIKGRTVTIGNWKE
jgi:prepilin-type N-terminal cleavage/methylation domain-containing protein